MKMPSPVAAGIATIVVISIYPVWSYFATGEEREWSDALDHIYEQSLKLGLPTTQDDLKVRIPDEQNAAIPVAAAEIVINETAGLWPGADAVFNGPDHFKYQRAVDKVKAADKQLDEIVSGLKRPGWFEDRDIDIVFRPGMAGSFLWITLEMLLSRCFLRAVEGDIQGCLSDFRAARRWGEHFAHRRDGHSQASAVSYDRGVLLCAEQLAALWVNKPSLREQLADLIEATDFSIDPRPTFRLQMYEALAWMRNFDTFGGMGFLNSNFRYPTVDPKRLKRSGLPTGRFERAQLAIALADWNRFFKYLGTDQAPRPGWEIVPDLLTLERESPKSWKYDLSRLLFEPSNRLTYFFAEFKMRSAMTVALIREMGNLTPRTYDLPIPDVYTVGQFVKLHCKDGKITISSSGPTRVPDTHTYNEPIKLVYPMPKQTY